jgi:hypothetical protein
MCAKLDVKIEHYERIRSSIGDRVTVDRIKELVAEMNTQKGQISPRERVGGGALRRINFSKMSKMEQRRDREGSMLVLSPPPTVSTGD